MIQVVPCMSSNKVYLINVLICLTINTYFKWAETCSGSVSINKINRDSPAVVNKSCSILIKSVAICCWRVSLFSAFTVTSDTPNTLLVFPKNVSYSSKRIAFLNTSVSVWNAKKNYPYASRLPQTGGTSELWNKKTINTAVSVIVLTHTLAMRILLQFEFIFIVWKSRGHGQGFFSGPLSQNYHYW